MTDRAWLLGIVFILEVSASLANVAGTYMMTPILNDGIVPLIGTSPSAEALKPLLMMIIRRCICAGNKVTAAKNRDVPVLIYWAVMYGFSLVALIHLGIASAVPVYFIFGVVMGAGTLYLAVRE